MKLRLSLHTRILIGCLFLCIFLARFSVCFIEFKAKAQYAATTEDGNENSTQDSEEKTEYKKSASEYEHFTHSAIVHILNNYRIAEIFCQPASSTQPWHLSVPTPPPNFTA